MDRILVKDGNPALTHSELLLEDYFRKLEVQFEREPEVPERRMRPDYLVDPRGSRVWIEVKELEAPRQRPTIAFDPLPAITEKIDQGRKKFKEFKGSCCGLVLHSCKSIYRPAPIEYVLAAMLGANSSCDPLSIEHIPDEPYRFHFSGASALRIDCNTRISAVIILQHWHVVELWVDVRNELRERQANGEKILPLSDQKLLAERQNEPIQITHPDTTRCVVLENPYAAVAFPRDLFNGPFDQRWGNNGRDYTLIWIGSELGKLRERPNPVPYVYL